MDHAAFLARLRGRLRLVLVADGLARLAVILAAVVAGLVAIDWAVHLPGWLRGLGLAAIAAAAVAVARKRLLRPLALAADDRALAILAERRRPELAGRLASRVEGLALGPADEAALAAALEGLPGSALIPARKLPRNAAAAGALLIAGLAVAAAMPWVAADGLTRLFAPWSGAEWRRIQDIVAGIERPVIAVDEQAVLTIARQAGPPAPVVVSWRAAGARQAEERQLSGLSGPWRHAVGLPAGRWEFTVASGDAEPVVLAVEVVERAAIAAVRAQVRPPAYAGQPEVRVPTLAVTALAGSDVAFTADAVAPSAGGGRRLASAWLDLPGGTRVPLQVDRLSIGGSFRLAAGAAGEIVLGGLDGDGLALAPARFLATPVPDRAPVASLSGPRNDEMVAPGAVIALAAEGSDDLALADLALELRIRGGSASAADHRVWTDVAGAATARRPLELPIAGLAKPGEVLLLTARARDANDVSGPGIGRSAPLALRVADEDAVRADLARMTADAKERVGRAREELGRGLADAERLYAAARAAGLAADKAGDLLAQLDRRWKDNRLPADQVDPARRAAALVAGAAQPLADAAAGAAPAARQADAALADAERLLAQMVQEGDLGRLLAGLIARQEAIGQATRALARDYLVKPLDDEGRARRADLVKRQDELAEQVRELERRILGEASSQLDPAKELVRGRAPGDRLGLAARQLAADDQRTRAVESQADALQALKKLQELLRGSDAAGALADRAGELAWREEVIARAVERSDPPQAQAAAQERLRQDVERLRADAQSASPQAGALAEAAAAGARQAGEAMEQGDRPAAAREAAATAALLRELQRSLAGGEPEDGKRSAQERDVMAVLRELQREQAKAVAEAARLERAHGDDALPFAAARAAGALGQTETDLALVAQEEIVARLDRLPLAKEAGERIRGALAAAGRHFIKPAAGARGRRLATAALAEIARLIAIVEAMPPGEQRPGGGDGAQPGGQQPPFPPLAELALLAAIQDEVARLTAAGRGPIAEDQARVRDLVEAVLSGTRPGSRGHLLLTRAWRAAAQAAELLAGKDRGAVARTEQDVAALHLRQVLAEAERQGGGQGQQAQQNQRQQRRDQPPPAGGGQQPQPGQGQAAPAVAGGNPAPRPGEGARVQVQAVGEAGELLHLPPERREQLRNAREQLKSARAQQLFERYLELLEEGR